MKGEVVHCEDGRIVRDLGNGIISVFVPFDLTNGRRKPVQKIIPPADASNEQAPTPLQVAVAKAHVWQRWIDEGKYTNAQELAEAVGVDASFVRRFLRWGGLSPRIVEEALRGMEPEMSLCELVNVEMPVVWEEQEEMFACSPVV